MQNGSQSTLRSVDSSPSGASFSAFSQAPPQAPSQVPRAPQQSHQGPPLQQHGSQPFHATQQQEQQQQYRQQPTQQYSGQQQVQQQPPQWAQSPTQLPQHPSGGFGGPRHSLDQPGQQSSAQQFGYATLCTAGMVRPCVGTMCSSVSYLVVMRSG